MPVQTAIGDVTHSLTSLLKEHQDPEFFEVTSESPNHFEEGSDGRPLVNLFLFHIEANPMGTGAPHRVVGPEKRRRAGLSLHLYYLMSALAGERADEHRALGTAMGIMHHFVEIEPGRLKGALHFQDQALKVDLCAYSIEDQTRIWSALGSNYRLSVFYRVRLVTLESDVAFNTPRSQAIATEFTSPPEGRQIP